MAVAQAGEFDIDKASVTPMDDGGAVVDFDPLPENSDDQHAFDGNLTDIISEDDLSRMGLQLSDLVEQDDQSRHKWKDTFKKGLKLLGLEYEERTEPWANACGAFHPMMLEAVLRFNAEAMKDYFPGSGPVKVELQGTLTEEAELQMNRVKRDLNDILRHRMIGFYDDTDTMLFAMPFVGSTFRKWRYDKRYRRPSAEYLLSEHVIIPYSASSIETAERFTVTLIKSQASVEADMHTGFYREIELVQPAKVVTSIQEEKDRLEGRTDNTMLTGEIPRHLYEIYTLRLIEEDTFNTSGLPAPYIITVDRDSDKVLAVRRDWRENDQTYSRPPTVVQHKYLPGFGPYGMGLLTILGGLSESATALVRQLVDAGTLANLSGGFKTSGLRIEGDDSPIAPAEFRDVSVDSGTLKDNILPLPYKDPSVVLLELLKLLTDEGRRIGSVADMKITDMTGQNVPVGTTIAIIQRSMVTMSQVRARLFESTGREFKILQEIVRDFMSDEPYPFQLAGADAGATRAQDYNDQIRVIPVADPNISTMAERILIAQAVMQLAAQAPQIYDLKAVHRHMIRVLGESNVDRFVPPDEQVMPADPITENLRLLTMKPVRVGIGQDHAAHIAVHLGAAQDPQVVAMLQNNPSAPAIMGAANSHIMEHLGFKYRVEMQEVMGVPLPPPDQPLPEDVEVELSRLAAMAANKLLGKHKAAEAQKAIEAAQQDPIIQLQVRELDLKEREMQMRAALDKEKLDDKAKDRIVTMLKALIQEEGATERETIAAQLSAKSEVSSTQLKRAEIAARFGESLMGQVSNVVSAKIKAAAGGKTPKKP